MRWQELFADLEGAARALERAEHDSEVAERTRAEVAQIGLLDRLRASSGRQVALVLVGGQQVRGRLDRVGRDWLLVSSPDETIVPIAALSVAADLPLDAVSAEAAGLVQSRLGLGAVLRAVARDRSVVTVHLRNADVVVGTPDRVGRDFLDVAEHEPGTGPRPADVRRRATIAYEAIVMVRRSDSGWA